MLFSKKVDQEFSVFFIGLTINLLEFEDGDAVGWEGIGDVIFPAVAFAFFGFIGFAAEAVLGQDEFVFSCLWRAYHVVAAFHRCEVHYCQK